jgi:hypothetical protein
MPLAVASVGMLQVDGSGHVGLWLGSAVNAAWIVLDGINYTLN